MYSPSDDIMQKYSVNHDELCMTDEHHLLPIAGDLKAQSIGAAIFIFVLTDAK